MSASIGINTAISFIVHTLEDLQRKCFPFLKPLIDMIEHYHREFRNNGSVEYLQKILDQLNSYQTYKDVMSYFFDLCVDVMNDIICYLRKNYHNFLQELTVRLLEIYSYFLNNYVKCYLKNDELHKIICYLKGVASRETLMEMMYDDSILTMIISILYPPESTIGSIISLISTGCPDELKTSLDIDMTDLVDRMSCLDTKIHYNSPVSHDSEDVLMSVCSPERDETSYFTPIIEKHHEESKEDNIKRILGKYGKGKYNELDKSPPKFYEYPRF